MALNLLMLGPPGAGKGTQAERFARTRGIPKISTGDILREAVQAGTEIGRRAKAIMDSGELVRDDVLIGIVKERLDRDDARSGFVLDGFPRTVEQAEALDAIMAGRDPLIVVEIEVPEAELMRRLASRLVCEDCGADASAPDPGLPAAGTMMVPPGGTEGTMMAPPGGTTATPEVAAAMGAQTEPLRCRRCGGRFVPRADDNEAVVRERLRVYNARTRPLAEFYRARPTFRVINGAQPPDVVAAEFAAAIGAADPLARPCAERPGVAPGARP
jgi:adenylate kinase